MQDAINWLNLNQGTVMVILTLAYVITTILLLLSNKRQRKQNSNIQKQNASIHLFEQRYALFANITRLFERHRDSILLPCQRVEIEDVESSDVIFPSESVENMELRVALMSVEDETEIGKVRFLFGEEYLVALNAVVQANVQINWQCFLLRSPLKTHRKACENINKYGIINI